MKQIDEKALQLGDYVELSDGICGTVVCNISRSLYTDKYQQKDWEYLKSGVLINSEEVGLVHYDHLNEIRVLKLA